MSDVRQKFKQWRESVLAFFSKSPDSDLTGEAARQRRNDALTQFVQAAATLLIGLWIAPVFFAQGPVVVAVAVACSLPFFIQGFKTWTSDSPSLPLQTTYKSPSSASQTSRTSTSLRPAHRTARTKKSPSQAHQSSRTAKSPNPITKGTQAQETIAIILRDLQEQGWKITYNLPIPDLGNVDAFLQSPKNNSFIVNVQSYQGEVFFDEGILKRRDWKQASNFEQDLLQQVTNQALAVKKIKRLRNVTPVLCFTNAVLSIETVNNKAREVYVVKKESLVRKLVRLDNG
ncbi:MAG: NERD domain-containing protein [Cyanobacteriota bacterium]